MCEYTKGQLNIINRVNTMFGKVYSEQSLITELNKILRTKRWKSQIEKQTLIVKLEILNLDFDIRFQCVSKKEFKLNSFSYTNTYEKIVC